MESEKPMKKTLGRRKIEMKKIKNERHLQVTFTKRRQGLFRKDSELAILCGAEVGIIVQSPADKVYTFESPSLETLINRISPESEGMMNPKSCQFAVAMEKETETETSWWDDPIEDLELDQLEQHLAALQYLRNIVGMKMTMEKY